MTAEIAILNKSAASLASDSAVTIGDGPSAKIYDTVNKIFEISEHQPIALMVYGDLEFMGLPFEIITKYYRRTRGTDNNFATIKACAKDFVDFLETDVRYEDRDIRTNVGRIAYTILKETVGDIERAIWDDIISRGKFLLSKQNRIAQEVIKEKIDKLKELPPSEPFKPGHLTGILEGREQFILAIADELLRTTMARRTQQTDDLLLRMIRYKLHKNEFSANRSGLVICGFGSDEMCPSLETIEIDGIINGRLKRKSEKSVNVGRDGVGADVLAFAQDEMVRRFLMGIDPAYETYIMGLGENTLRRFAAEIISALRSNTTVHVPDNLFDPTIGRLMSDVYNKIEERKTNDYRNKILNMVEFMPKQELATFAKSLVDLTSLKRRVSAERETVGGEVDVAVISKDEGLVWIQRKHYFPAELNPRFFERHYRGG